MLIYVVLCDFVLTYIMLCFSHCFVLCCFTSCYLILDEPVCLTLHYVVLVLFYFVVCCFTLLCFVLPCVALHCFCLFYFVLPCFALHCFTLVERELALRKERGDLAHVTVPGDSRSLKQARKQANAS